MTKPTKRDLQKIATSLGYQKGIKSYSDIYVGGTFNTFGYKSCSMWVLTIHLDRNNLVRCIEVYTTHFKVTEQVNRVNKFIETNGNQPHTKILELLT